MTAPLLSARGLRLAFGGVKAADGIDLDVMPGEFLAIIGPNGAGSALGPFLGATAFELVRVYAGAAVADAWQMILGGVLLAVILFAPGGLIGILSRQKRKQA